MTEMLDIQRHGMYFRVPIREMNNLSTNEERANQ